MSRNGKWFEEHVASLVVDWHGERYNSISKKEYDEFVDKTNRLVSQYPYVTLYGYYETSSFGRLDFYLNLANVHHYIEVKWQEHPGTTDEKLVYALHNMKNMLLDDNHDVVKKIIVVGGDGYRQGALAYLKEHAGEVSIMDDNEFSLYIESLKKE
jgi:hypothetical protein